MHTTSKGNPFKSVPFIEGSLPTSPAIQLLWREILYRGYRTTERRFELYFRVVKYCFYHRKATSHRVIFVLLYRQIYRSPFFTLFAPWKTTVKTREITSLISSLVRMWKIRHSGSRCSFTWILRVGYFQQNNAVHIVKNDIRCGSQICSHSVCYLSCKVITHWVANYM